MIETAERRATAVKADVDSRIPTSVPLASAQGILDYRPVDAASRVRNLMELDISDGWDGRGRCHLIEFTISANGFLQYMVRSIVGTLLAVGRGEIDQETVARAISEGDRSLAGATAPAHGLTLMSVEY